MNKVRPTFGNPSSPHSSSRCVRGFVMVMLCSLLLPSCSRDDLKRLINKLGSPDQEKPEVYHEFEGYSPGAKKTQGKEDFNRYHYYIAPEREEVANTDPDIYFRQDYESIDPVPTFDEEQYWRDFPLVADDNPTPEPKSE